MSAPVRPYAVVLAGGIGRRFWPASTPERPKQLLPLASDRPLVVDTVERALEVAGPGRVLVVAGAEILPALRPLLPRLSEDDFLVEPVGRGTGPALAWAAHELGEREPDAVMISMHADHVIEPEGEFRRTVRRAAEAAARGGRLYCIGIHPDRPETGYGYVRLGRRTSPGIYEAQAFVEKPDHETASRYLASGEYVWNSGIFAWRVDDLLRTIRDRAREISTALPRLEEGDVEGFFEAVEPVTIDVAVMERAPAVGVVEATFRWDDVGTWAALARTRAPDAAGNTIVGRGVGVDARGNIVWAEEGRVTLFGVTGLVVVRSGEETLIMSRERAAELKHLLRELEEDEGDG